jgi:hypothetical protein
MSSDSRIVCAAVLAILVAGLLVFGQVGTFEFVTADDKSFIVENSAVNSWSQAPWRERLLTTKFTYVMPVTQASFALDWRLWNGWAGGFHITNLLLHLACSLLVLFVARRLFAPAAPAVTVTLAGFVGALFFLLHPLQAEAVSFVTQRKDLLGTFFALLALGRLLGARTTLNGVLVLLAVVLAGLAKPTMLLLGPVLVTLHWLLRRGSPMGRTEIVLGILLMLVAPLLFALNWHVHSQAPDTLDASGFSLVQRFMLVCRTAEHYLHSLILPIYLAPKVPRPALDPSLLPIVITIAVVATLAVVSYRRWCVDDHVGLIPLVWCVGMYLPISNLIPIRRYVADGYLYAAMVGIALVVCRVCLWLLGHRDRLNRVILAVALGAVFGVTGHLAQRQASIWRNEGALFDYLYTLFPNNTDAVQQYADYLKDSTQKKRSHAILLRFYMGALQKNPSSLRARHRLMRLYLASGMVQRARQLLDRAPPSVRDRTAYWEARLELAMQTRQYADALKATREILRRDPRSPRRRLLKQLEKRVRE